MKIEGKTGKLFAVKRKTIRETSEKLKMKRTTYNSVVGK
jgi:hypothetical protein